ncbi:hypothetical protein LY78DRAFT_342906 [Colletotrichum sublineola]|nr:hypothetical protein LY78DRAFT_342906 [Colletotrichum sublineola]
MHAVLLRHLCRLAQGCPYSQPSGLSPATSDFFPPTQTHHRPSIQAPLLSLPPRACSPWPRSHSACLRKGLKWPKRSCRDVISWYLV